MKMANSMKFWWALFILSTAILIVLSPGMVTSIFKISAGRTFANLMDSNVNEVIAKTNALRTGYLAGTLYFFGFPFPVYLLTNLVSAKLLKVAIRGRRIPFWLPALTVYLLGTVFLALSARHWYDAWAIGAVGVWIIIVVIILVAAGIAKLGWKIIDSMQATLK